MDAPGIEIRPIIEMTGSHTFNEVFFDDVRLPAENLVGDVNRGWGLAKVTLGNERVSLSSGGALWGMGPTADDLLDLVRAAGGTADPVLRQRLAQLHIEHELLRLIRLRTVTARIKGEPPGRGGVGAQDPRRRARPGDHGPGQGPGRRRAGCCADSGPLGGPPAMWHYGFLFSPALTVGGGTGEVQRNIVAERVLGPAPRRLRAERPQPGSHGFGGRVGAGA